MDIFTFVSTAAILTIGAVASLKGLIASGVRCYKTKKIGDELIDIIACSLALYCITALVIVAISSPK